MGIHDSRPGVASQGEASAFLPRSPGPDQFWYANLNNRESPFRRNLHCPENRGPGGNRFEGTVGLPELISTVVEDGPAGKRYEPVCEEPLYFKSKLGLISFGFPCFPAG